MGEFIGVEFFMFCLEVDENLEQIFWLQSKEIFIIERKKIAKF